MSQKIMGIDLGTTFSCIGVMKGGKVQLINIDGQLTIPSVVGFPTDGGILCGHTAKTLQESNVENTIYDMKRMIGKRFNSNEINQLNTNFPFTILKDNNNDEYAPIMIEVNENEKKVKYTPEEISSKILNHLTKYAMKKFEKNGNEPEIDAVITVPAAFNENQRKQTKIAGSIANLNVIGIINEPSAAAISYFYDDDCKLKESIKGKVLVFDVGGGTFDISILELDANVSTSVIATVSGSWGDPNLGGEDFNNDLYNHCLCIIPESDNLTNFEKDDIRNKCVKIKEWLSFSKSAPFVFRRKQYNIKRSEFEELINKHLIKIEETLQTALRKALCYPKDIYKVLLVGGSTKIPAIQDVIKRFFANEIKENKNLISESENADTAIARGATIYAHFLSDNDTTNSFKLVDVTPLRLGIANDKNVFSEIIEANRRIPCAKEQLYTTTKDNLTEIDIIVLQGSSDLADHNTTIGKFKLSGLPSKPKGYVQIKCKFKLNNNGMLQVEAEDANNKDTMKRICIDREKLFKQNNCNHDKSAPPNSTSNNTSNGDNNNNKNNNNDDKSAPSNNTSNGDNNNNNNNNNNKNNHNKGDDDKSNNGKKRKRLEVESRNGENTNNPPSKKQKTDKDEKESRKRKLSPNNNNHILAPKLKKPNLNTNTNIIPTEICVSGYGKDKDTYSKFESYAKQLGIPSNKKWSIASTQILISKYDAFNGKPFVSFKVLASILCGIPVVKQGYLQDSYEQNKVLDYNNYICNYRRIDNSNGIFKGLKILLKKYSTNMPSDRLKTLLTLGKATILERFETDINNKDIKEKDNRIMICSYDIEWREAKQFSEEYNCNVISESWIIKCIYDDEINQINDGRKPVVDRYKLEPINERVDFEEFDKTINTDDDSN